MTRLAQQYIGSCKRLTYNDHESIYVVLAARMLLQPRPNLENIKHILAKAAKHKSDRAMYFKIMLKVLACGGFPKNKVFLDFQDLFENYCDIYSIKIYIFYPCLALETIRKEEFIKT